MPQFPGLAQPSCLCIMLLPGEVCGALCSCCSLFFFFFLEIRELTSLEFFP